MQQEYKYIYQVYQDGSFSKAAENLYITQPALSIAIQKTEAAIGMPLFDRSRRPLRLTAAGEIYIDMIKKIENLEFDLKQRLLDIRNLNIGTIRIGGTHYINSYILPGLLTEFSKDYPGIHLDVIEEGSDVLADMLDERKIDLTVSCDASVIKRFKKYPFFHDYILLAIPVDDPVNRLAADAALTGTDILNRRHLDPSCPAVSLKMFQDLEFILLTAGNNLHERVLHLFQAENIEPLIKTELSQLATAYHMAAEGFAATFVSDQMIRNSDSSLYFYKIDSDICKRTFYTLVSNEKYISSAVKKLQQYLTWNR